MDFSSTKAYLHIISQCTGKGRLQLISHQKTTNKRYGGWWQVIKQMQITRKLITHDIRSSRQETINFGRTDRTNSILGSTRRSTDPSIYKREGTRPSEGFRENEIEGWSSAGSVYLRICSWSRTWWWDRSCRSIERQRQAREDGRQEGESDVDGSEVLGVYILVRVRGGER